MASIFGTTGTDTLFGTAGNDILTSYGSTLIAGDTLIGGAGADTYDLRGYINTSTFRNFLIDDRGADDAVDTITNVGALYYSASLGYQGWARAIRVGDDLIIDTPGRPSRFRKPGRPEYHIEIKDQYGDGEIEYLVADGVTYALVTGSIGTFGEDIMAGTNGADDFQGLDGNDWVFGNGGNDRLSLGNGNDIAFGGNGRDKILGGAGSDRIFGERGGDKILGDAGADWIEGGLGNDRINGGDDSDYLSGDEGDDLIRGGNGNDVLIGGDGNDKLSGGRGGDNYQFTAGWGHDIIVDNGSKAQWNEYDSIVLRGFYGPSSGSLGTATSRLSFARVGADMVMTADGGASTLTVKNMFHAKTGKYFVEKIIFSAGYWQPVQFVVLDGAKTAIGDDRNYAGGYTGSLNEVIFGTDKSDLIYGDAGTNFIWTGDGNDVLIYKENDSKLLYGLGGGDTFDIVEDFDVLHDKMDFSEIKGLTMTDLVISEQPDGDVTITWLSGNFEVSDIYIELRGVTLNEINADLFIFG